ncbi:hypothetical protein BDQ17DRAFT_1441200 [Cyathus striatus]|nr:hypothetical protein BDQ17DRAFT_1441200 [Cyathus striatus]
MPPSRNYHVLHRFSPSTLRMQFSPECLLTPLPCSFRTCYPLNEGGESETSSVVVLIPKPKGEAGKNYKLVDHVQCSPEQLSDMETRISVIAKEVLDFSRTYTTQEQSKLTTVCEKAANQYPDLLKYDSNWVMLNIIKIILRNHRKGCRKSTTTTKEVGTGLKEARAVRFAGSRVG